MTGLWPWLTFAGLGAFHGLNPAMGWLFAVALGQHRQSRSAVALAILPIAVGHLVSVALVAALLLALGPFVPARNLRIAAGMLLVGWALWHWRYGHRHRVRFGLRVGLLGLGLWSFLMATAHGAGLMLLPALMETCLDPVSGGGVPSAIAGVGVHTLAMALTAVCVAGLVSEWLGLGVLRRAWVNVDLLWMWALGATGVILLATAG